MFTNSLNLTSTAVAVQPAPQNPIETVGSIASIFTPSSSGGSESSSSSVSFVA